MAYTNRKQLPICRNCRIRTHKRQYDSTKLSLANKTKKMFWKHLNP